ncbi:MAG: HutD family protein [Rhizobiaceae bacterium]|nr:HutD family protein [Rhizobiaceae bacterium]
MTVRILRARDHRSMPWKNGGGLTTEIAAFPEGSDLETFEWRVSMARVENDGPFSTFAGIDRTLAVLEGNGIALTIEDCEPVPLRCGSTPFAFPADAPTEGRLADGPILDLNVMARRGKIGATVERVARTHFDMRAIGDWTLLFVNFGQVDVSRRDFEARLGDKDCLVASGPGSTFAVSGPPDAEVFVIRLT